MATTMEYGSPPARYWTWAAAGATLEQTHAFTVTWAIAVGFLIHCTTVGTLKIMPLVIFFSFFPTFLPAQQHMEFPGQVSDQSHSCDLHHSCGNTGFLTHCARPGLQPVSQPSRDATASIVPVWTPVFFFFFWYLSLVDLQCCVSFRCTAQWFSYTYVIFIYTYMCVCIYIHIYICLSHYAVHLKLTQ